MNNIEDQLRQELSRKQPSAGFAGRVAARAGASPYGVAVRPRRSPAWKALGAIAACLSVAGAFEFHRYQQGQFAKQQVMLALRITSDKTHVAQQKVDQLNKRSFLHEP